MAQTIRKIIKSDYSYLITLPIFWVESLGLSEDDYVECVLVKDGRLVLQKYVEEEDEDEEES